MSNKVTVKININGIIYPISCEAGEEERLIESSEEVNKVISQLANFSEGVSESRLLAMTSLILADKIIENGSVSQNTVVPSIKEENLKHINELIDWLIKATERMNKVAKLLENK